MLSITKPCLGTCNEKPWRLNFRSMSLLISIQNTNPWKLNLLHLPVPFLNENATGAPTEALSLFFSHFNLVMYPVCKKLTLLSTLSSWTLIIRLRLSKANLPLDNQILHQHTEVLLGRSSFHYLGYIFSNSLNSLCLLVLYLENCAVIAY